MSDGTDTYKGIETLIWRKPLRRSLPVRKEGESVPSAIHKVGTSGLVSFSITSRAQSTLATLCDATPATLTFTVEDMGAETTATITITGPSFEETGGQVGRDAEGRFTLTGMATAIAIA